MKKRWIASLMALAIMLATPISMLTANAAVYKKALVGKSVGPSDIYASEGVELTKDGNIVFGEKSGEKTRLTSKTKIEIVESETIDTEVLFAASYTLNATTVSGRFGFMFGLQSSVSQPQTGNSTFVYIDGKDGLSVGVSFANKTMELNEKVTLTAGEDVAFEVLVRSNGALKVTAGDTIVYDGEAGVNPVGYVGFGQTASSQVIVSNVSVDALINTTPENYNHFETFESGMFNGAVFQSSGSGTNMEIRDGKMYCEDLSSYSITTKKNYANTEFVFDVSDMQRTSRKDNLVYSELINYDFNVTLGITTGDSSSRKVRVQFIPIGGSSIERGDATEIRIYKEYAKTPDHTVILPAKYHIWNEETVNSRMCNIKVRVVDGELSLFLKYDDECGYYNALNYTLGYIPEGKISLSGSSGNNTSDYARMRRHNIVFDNLGVCNLDYKAKVLDNVWKSNKLNHPDDFEFVDSWSDSDLLG